MRAMTMALLSPGGRNHESSAGHRYWLKSDYSGLSLSCLTIAESLSAVLGERGPEA